MKKAIGFVSSNASLTGWTSTQFSVFGFSPPNICYGVIYFQKKPLRGAPIMIMGIYAHEYL